MLTGVSSRAVSKVQPQRFAFCRPLFERARPRTLAPRCCAMPLQDPPALESAG